MHNRTLLVVALLSLLGAAAIGAHKTRAPITDEDARPTARTDVVRHGWVIKVKPEKLEEYKELHANAWPEILDKIYECNIRNYSIYYRDGYLFSYLEYIGDDWEGDMAKMADDPKTQEWWEVTDPCQEPVDTAEEGEWWAPMEEVFHTD